MRTNGKHKKLDDAIAELKSDPLFYLFLASKELFHSNFWFWLSTVNSCETLRLFVKDCKKENYQFYREGNVTSEKDGKSKIDISVYDSESNPICIIENKVKDFPTIEQLSRIKNSCGHNTTHYVLTTLFWIKGLKFSGWHVVTYRDIASRLSPKSFDAGRHTPLIKNYKSFLIKLSSLASTLPASNKYDFAVSWERNNLYSKLNDIKLWEAYQRMRASHLVHLYNTRYGLSDIGTKVSIYNQKATIDFILQLDNDYKIGIQIEDNQLRKYVRGAKAEILAQRLRETNLFFSRDYKSPQGLTFLKYDKPAEQFRHQYETISPNIKFAELFADVNRVLGFIKKHRRTINKKTPRQ